MTFRKIKGNESEIIVETKVTDGAGRLFDKWKVLKEDFPSVVRILNEKHDIGMIIKKKDKDRDLEWMK